MNKTYVLCALFLLAGCGRKEAVFQGKPTSYWVKQLKGINNEARVEAADALGVMGPDAKGAKAALTLALKDEDTAVRQRAACALGRIDPHDAAVVPPLVALLKDQDVEVRRQAALALGRLGPTAKDAVSALDEACKDADSQFKILLREAIQRINLEIPVNSMINSSEPGGAKSPPG